MKLDKYLKQFNNIAWYPSAYRDFKSMMCLSSRILMNFGIHKDEAPDCFVFTDYLSYARYEENYRFFLDLDEFTSEITLNWNEEYETTIYNIKELDKLKIGFDPEMTEFYNDQNYGRVFVADVLVNHPKFGKNVAKLVYIICENTKFAFDFLLKKGIKVKYAIHNCYGHGFGSGRSNGSYMLQILKDLGVRYLVSDMGKNYVGDDADIYLSEEQKKCFPILKEKINYTSHDLWYGYDTTYLYEVVGFKEEQSALYNKGRFYFDFEIENSLHSFF